MTRNEFINRFMRYLLFMLLGAVAIIAGSRVTGRADCSSCPGKNICTGKSDCATYMRENNGQGRK